VTKEAAVTATGNRYSLPVLFPRIP
jgi:hypothetical protein